MILRCPHHECRRTFDTEFNALQYHKDKGRGYICPFCYKWIGVGIYHAKPAPRVKPHASKKERRRQREMKGLIKPPSKEESAAKREELIEKTVDAITADAEARFPKLGKE